jgi:hypothetical protein
MVRISIYKSINIPDSQHCHEYTVNVCRNFTEGWVEFLSKKVARRVADQLNNTQGKVQNPASQCCGAGAEIKLPPEAGAEITNCELRHLSIYHRLEAKKSLLLKKFL